MIEHSCLFDHWRHGHVMNSRHCYGKKQFFYALKSHFINNSSRHLYSIRPLRYFSRYLYCHNES